MSLHQCGHAPHPFVYQTTAFTKMGFSIFLFIGLFNRSGRGAADVALSHGYVLFYDLKRGKRPDKRAHQMSATFNVNVIKLTMERVCDTAIEKGECGYWID